MDMSEMGIDDPVFMQDNSSIHTSKLARAWFKDNDWTVAKHPAYSPDLNPIEHVWAYMKHQLHQRYPDLVNMRGSPEVVKEALADALTEIWNGIPASRLYTSMPRRVAAVIRAVPYITRKRLITGNWRTNRYMYLAPNLGLSTRVEAVTGKI